MLKDGLDECDSLTGLSAGVGVDEAAGELDDGTSKGTSFADKVRLVKSRAKWASPMPCSPLSMSEVLSVMGKASMERGDGVCSSLSALDELEPWASRS